MLNEEDINYKNSMLLRCTKKSKTQKNCCVCKGYYERETNQERQRLFSRNLEKNMILSSTLISILISFTQQLRKKKKVHMHFWRL